MKKRWICLIAILSLLFPASQAYAKGDPEPILYTYYRQMGWGDRVEIGYVDSSGDCWMLTGSDSELSWPYKTDEQIQFLRTHSFEKTGSLKSGELFDLKSLVSTVKPSDDPSHPAANDAGTERTYAVRYNKDGTPEPVLLGMSGDDVFENTDPAAQGLYLAVRNLFPSVTAYGGDMGPAGFPPVRITEFCGLDNLNGASVRAVLNDCESGPEEIELSRDEQQDILKLIKNGFVTGKVNAVGTTGGFRTYFFYRGDKSLGSIDIYGDLLYWTDGMYSIAETIGNG